jgi:DNA helicase II / ATP-dependent DNA helicase PcrA
MNKALEELNKEQLEAVTHASGPLIIIAGAGTGKTTVMTRRIGWAIENEGVKPDEILALTFTEKAATEMEERIDRLLPYGHVDLWIHTFHAFCERVLRSSGTSIGIDPKFTLLNEVDAWLLMRNNLNEFELDYYRPLGNPTKFIRALMNHFSRVKDEGIDPEEYKQFVDCFVGEEDELSRLREISNAYDTYERLLHEQSALDFGGLILYTLKLFEKRPHILKEYQDQFKHILVDEFQDTNRAQYKLIELLNTDDCSLAVVGDDDQAIYKFRGASIDNILQFENDFPSASRVVLTKNYRSAQGILDSAHSFIQANNPRRLEVTGKSKLSKRLESQTGNTGNVQHIHVHGFMDEVRAVIDEIHQLRKGDADLNWSDIAILVRANDHATPFLQGLGSANIPYAFHAMKGLYRKPIVLDAIALLHVIDQPHESASMYRWFSHPSLGIQPLDLARIAKEAKKNGLSLFDAMQDPPKETSAESRRVISEFTAFLEETLEYAQRRNALEVLASALKKSGLYGHVLQQEDAEQYENAQWLQQFYERVRRYIQTDEGATLHTFLEAFTAERHAGEMGDVGRDIQAGPDEVRVMTIHSSKGLEFKYVFIVNLVERRFPSSRRADPIPIPDGICALDETDKRVLHLEEERRLMYVAITRAKKGVFITSAEDYGGVRAKKQSIFLSELGFDPPPATQSNKKEEQYSQKTDHLVSYGTNLPVPSTFSFTQLIAYDHCPLQYKFAHVLKIPVPGNWALSFGKTMHNTLQAFFELWVERKNDSKSKAATNLVSSDELIELYEANWLDGWYEDNKQREEYRESGREQLIAAYSSFISEPRTPLFLERGFTIKIDDIVLKGRVDRIDQVEGGVEIIDYKTGKPKTLKTLNPSDKMQLLLYQLVAKDVFELVPKKLTFHYLSDNSEVSFIGTEKDLDSLRATIRDRISQIRGRQFDATPGFSCGFCDYKDICPFRV